MARLGGIEPPTHGLEVRCSIQLSYRRISFCGAGEGNRTLATSLEGWGSTTELHPQNNISSFHKNSNQLDKHFGGDERIRTTESKANGFTVRPIWPTLEHPHVFLFKSYYYLYNKLNWS